MVNKKNENKKVTTSDQCQTHLPELKLSPLPGNSPQFIYGA